MDDRWDPASGHRHDVGAIATLYFAAVQTKGLGEPSLWRFVEPTFRSRCFRGSQASDTARVLPHLDGCRTFLNLACRNDRGGIRSAHDGIAVQDLIEGIELVDTVVHH
jgi:hypothetical protein